MTAFSQCLCRTWLTRVLVALVLFLALGEVAARLILAKHLVYDVEMVRYALALKQKATPPALGHVHRPNTQATLMGVPVAINDAGCRDDPVPVARTTARRVAVLGDSITLGWGVRHEDTFADRLEHLLSKTTPTEVINFGIGNYNTAQEAALFETTGLAYKPDSVVLFYFINDAEPTPARSGWWWLGHSRFVTLFWSRLRAACSRETRHRNFRQYYADLYAGDAPGWRRTQEALQALCDVCRAHDMDFRVVILPDLHRLTDYPFAEQHAGIKAFLDEQGVACLDLAPAMADVSDPRALWVAPDDAHPNAQGHALIAERTVDFVEAGLRRQGER